MRENMKQKYPLLHKIGKMLLTAADRVTVFARKVEMIPGKVPEILTLLVYAVAHLCMALVFVFLAMTYRHRNERPGETRRRLSKNII